MKLGMTVLACGGALLCCTAQAQTVTIDTGKVAGVTADGIVSWKGIPFATPPVGELRWRAPQPAARWSGVRQATAYGHDCMQLPFPSDAAPLGTTPAEDCLTVNVWKPAAATAKLPVIVWIYGGGFVNGGASPPTYSGANFARQGVMFVSFNYRLGRFGTFAHPQLTAQDPDKGRLGNYGYMDQIAALRWVKRNIVAFGGDPANVTIVGESAGGMSVNTLVTSPLAKGLFARAIVMSGGDGHNRGNDGLTGTERIGVDFAASKGIARDDPAALAKLRALSADDVTDGLNLAALFMPAPGPKTFASPYADGVVAVDAAAAYRSGAFPKVPIMIGATDNDIGGPTGYMVAGARQLAGAIAAAGAPAYHYRFSYVAEGLGKTGADHATDIPWFFDTATIKYGNAITPRDRRMARTISAYIVNFAKTGNPNSAGLPRWPRYDRARDELLDFTAKGEAVSGKDPLGAAIDAAPASIR
ncbi:carboxylesterase/lipase family protein [Sphingomonas carotinifaciens]|uniref:Carboxylic ester hydrolase n=1 Tax=Sphingomonas carotinifaciens TaxID=1166323 RepID=A0A1G7P0B0_9SPHN|nr:carboxylesterase family protein [Sphingomonas carotinifaciens]MBB4087254.1 para-nitrobenzyl esterase [Sphingomonas carotinifaciens]MWC44713.1 carboxylesterase family protein [Sphingomonas carotinifaciens]SDF79664.1 para-nitrobenzyl esterase [Sphingomonas carotinifaciens]